MPKLSTYVLANMVPTCVLVAGVCVAMQFAIAAPTPPSAAKSEPWERHTIEGYVESTEGFVMFGAGPKMLGIDTGPQKHYLSFASESDYKAAERAVGLLVVAEGYIVQCGHERRFVPVVLRERVK